MAYIREDECIGCTKCIQACPVDAILGAAKQMHTVIASECTGCDLCVEPCPVDCIDMIPEEETLQNWQLAARPGQPQVDHHRHRRGRASRARRREEDIRLPRRHPPTGEQAPVHWQPDRPGGHPAGADHSPVTAYRCPGGAGCRGRRSGTQGAGDRRGHRFRQRAKHAPSSGTVAAIEERLIAHPSGYARPAS